MAVDGKRDIFTDKCKSDAYEGVASGTIRPGALVDWTSATEIAESTQAATVSTNRLMVADRAYLKTVDDNISTGEHVLARELCHGESANVLVADAQAITKIGTGLAANGAGVLAIATGSQHVIAYAEEIITTSGVQLVKVKGAK